MLKGKNALVTGSTRGIGLGVATALAEAGANVMINGFGDAVQIERLRAELSSQPHKRFVEVRRIGELVLFLSSAASSITGAALPIEGGWTAR